MRQGAPAAPAARRWKGGYEESFAGGGFDDERPVGGSAAPARARTPVNDLDDDIPF
jgi:hypothetical protein